MTWLAAYGRHTYCAPFKSWIVEQAMVPGVSLAGLAMSNQVNANQLRRWVQLHGKRSADSGKASRLLPVTVLAQEAPTRTAPSKAGGAMEIELAGAVVRVRDGVSPSTLRMVFEALRGTAP